MGSRLIALRALLQQGSLAAARAVAVASVRELPSFWALTHHAAQSSTLSEAPRALHGSPAQARYFHATAGSSAGVEVKVPALGESITDGTISVLLKQPGEAVSEDEPILQIETDKVVIDVRAPQAGVLEQFLVKESDNVVVGQPIATIGSGEGGAAPAPQPAQQQQAAAPATPPPQPAPAAAPPQPPRQQQPAPSFAASAAAAPAPKRKPSIRFPPRRTETGELISALPAAKAKSLLESLAQAEREAAKPRPTIAPIYQRSGPPLPSPPRQLYRPPPQLPRNTMSEREMEAIMLGGAEP